jgi:hypothetical protein
VKGATDPILWESQLLKNREATNISTGKKIHSQEADISVKINIRPEHTRSPN